MKKNTVVKTDEIIIKVDFIGEPIAKFSKIVAKEKSVFVNGELVFKEWQSWPQFQNIENTSVALENLEKQLSFRYHGGSSKQSSNNRRNFAQRVKVVWAKFLLKVFNFKS